MDENKEKLPNRRAVKIGLIALVSVLAVVIGSYCALCAWVSGSDQILPNTAAGGVDVSGLSRSAAETAIQTASQSSRAGQSLTVNAAGETVAVLDVENTLTVDAAATAQAAWQRGRAEGFVLAGWNWLQAHWAQPANVEARLSEGDRQALLERLSQYAQEFNQENAMEEPVWEKETAEDGSTVVALDFTLGVDGLSMDPQQACDQIAGAVLENDFSPLDLTLETVSAPEPDLEAIYQEIYAVPEDATYDGVTYEITPHVTGVSFDIAEVRAELKTAAAAGERNVRVETVLTQPELTTQELEDTLFRDVLGTCTTRVGGSANRLSNVRLAASMCDGTILLPGQQFSYNEATGPRTEAKGFLPAPSYVSGNTVDSVGGGICQVSSTIYLATLRANLEIVQRQNHSFAVGYVPDGMDATVYYGSVEFIFANNTNYPIKLEATVDGRSLTVSILGTNVDGTYAEITNRYLSTDPFETIYQEDASLQPGESRETVSGYTGKVVEVYRNIYDKDGNLISSTLENRSTYKRRDRVVLVGPQETATVQPTEPTVTTDPTQEPETTPTPEVTPAPEVTPTPEATSNPVETQPPAETPIPAESQPPVETPPLKIDEQP